MLIIVPYCFGMQIGQADQDFDLDIKEDVQEECSKFGAVKHIFVDK